MGRTAVKGPLAFTAANGTELETYDSSFSPDLRGIGSGFVEVQSNKLTHTFGSSSIFLYRDNTPTYSGDQYASVELGVTAGFPNSRYGVILRASADAGPNDDWYAVVVDQATNPQTTRTYKCVNGSVSSLDTRTSITWSSTDILLAEAITNGANCDIRAYKNGTLQFTVTDSSSPLTGGKPGFYLFDNAGGYAATIDNAEFGDITPSVPSLSSPTITGVSATGKTVGAGQLGQALWRFR